MIKPIDKGVSKLSICFTQQTFTQRSFYTQQAFTHSKHLHLANLYTQRFLYTASFQTQKLLFTSAHTEAMAGRFAEGNSILGFPRLLQRLHKACQANQAHHPHHPQHANGTSLAGPWMGNDNTDHIHQASIHHVGLPKIMHKPTWHLK